MLGKRPNKVYDPFLKARLGYENPERINKAITAQPKMYDGERRHNTKLIIDSPDYEETLEDTEESRLKMKNKIIQLNYVKLNALYETFVPQKEFSIEQTYFSTPYTSNVSFESSKEISDLPTPKMPNESKVLTNLDEMDEVILALQKNIDVTLLKDEKRIYKDDGQNILRQFYKTNVTPMLLSLIKHSKELKQELTEEVQKMLNIFESMGKKFETQSKKYNMFQNEIDRLLEASFTREIRDCVLISVVEQKNEILMLEKEKISSDSKDIQANSLKRIKILENDFKRSQAQTKTVNAVSDGSNIDCVSCGKDVFMLSHKKCVARYALSINSRVKRALFTSPIAAKSRNLGATFVVAKSRFSVAKTPTTTNKVIQIMIWIIDSGCSKHMTVNLQLLRNFIEKFVGTVHFGNHHFAAIIGYGDYVQGNLMICHRVKICLPVLVIPISTPSPFLNWWLLLQYA
ncbi:hypothetical protein Tco_1026948 [Tanacetum coccineum]